MHFLKNKAFKVKCEKIENPNKGRFRRQTTQIFQDCMYVYGEIDKRYRGFGYFRLDFSGKKEYELRSFDLSMRDIFSLTLIVLNRKSCLEKL